MKKNRAIKNKPRKPRNEIKAKIAKRKKVRKNSEKGARETEFINSLNAAKGWAITGGSRTAILARLEKEGATEEQVLTAMRRSYKFTRASLTRETAKILLAELTAKESNYLKDLLRELKNIKKKQKSPGDYVATKMTIISIVEAALWRHMTKGLL